MSTFAWRVPGGSVSTMSVLRVYALLTAACTIGLVVIAAFMGSHVDKRQILDEWHA